jgi:histidine triad (HIT) family protein
LVKEKKMAVYDPSNVFAKILRGEIPSQTVFEDDATLVIMDIMPRGSGHVLVIPKAACRNILDADDATVEAVARTTRKMAKVVCAAFKADGVTIQQFNEAAGGQVVFHLHVHIIPRFDGTALRAHTGAMENPAILATNAERIRATIAQMT